MYYEILNGHCLSTWIVWEMDNWLTVIFVYTILHSLVISLSLSLSLPLSLPPSLSPSHPPSLRLQEKHTREVLKDHLRNNISTQSELKLTYNKIIEMQDKIKQTHERQKQLLAAHGSK